MMRRYSIKKLAREFWETAGIEKTKPRDIESAILWALPVAIFKFPRLCLTDIEGWLSSKGISNRLSGSNRLLHGSVVAYGGRGCIFLNGSDDESERRYSLAHEAAHFLISYSIPRLKAVSILGETILEVFDGLRAPTVEERIDSILNYVPIGFHIHFMNRESVSDLGITRKLEENADLLALELLAPEDEIRQRVSNTYDMRSNECEEYIFNLLMFEYALPRSVADSYCRYLIKSNSPFSVRTWLGLK